MTQRTPLKRVRVSVEPAGSYAQDRTGTMANFADVRFTQADLARPTTWLADEAGVQRIHQRRAGHRGFKSATLDITGDLVPLAAPFDADATPTQDTLSRVLESMLACEAVRSAGSTVAASSDPAEFTAEAGHGARFFPTTTVLVETGVGTGIYVASAVAGVSTDTVTLRPELPFTPAVGARVLSGDYVYLGYEAVEAQTSLQFLVEGEDRDMIWLALGCQGPLAIEWPLGGLPRWSSQFAGANWLRDSEIATPQGGSPLSIATLSGGTPVPVTAGSIVFGEAAGLARTTPTIAELAVTLGSSWQPIDSYNGVEGKAKMAFSRGEQPTVSMLVLAEDNYYGAAFRNGAIFRLLAQAGNRAAGCLTMHMPSLELIAEPALEERNGLDWWRLQLGAVITDEFTSPWLLGRH